MFLQANFTLSQSYGKITPEKLKLLRQEKVFQF